eukprot:CAMPEP_0175822718 /NCGR_PEP_ID=MMETSP0107_2-20121207/9827_1 /TAXON_ID=195067 ORGANISM="Goniomonas pacifica, Strain CCMP1869" /NCGR_SAMPLE_ID=MMETSP0107_2 /ASSEMBLY_ACC=CAM_ASM_000203 /LENGTH=180 /DNA_ID=CAMNT_0017135201 /DNA_START=136 /DNA_END=679 /DNA_ORIENTATION=-
MASRELPISTCGVMEPGAMDIEILFWQDPRSSSSNQGLLFTAASTDLRREFGAVMVEQGSQGGPHKLTAIMPGIGQQRRPTTSKESILEDYRLGRTASCLLLRSKEARWSEEQGIYCLKFKGKGRVKIASAKNFMLVTPSNEDFVYVQFGKQDETTFSLDFRAPLCPFQAFAIAVAAFDQ